MMSTKAREKIKKHLESKNKLDKIATFAFNFNLHSYRDIMDVSRMYGIEYITLQRKLDIMNKLEFYLKKKCAFEKAVDMFLSGIKPINKCISVKNVKRNIISLEELEEEIHQYKKFKKGQYKYDKPVGINNEVFTFKEEIQLLTLLREVKEKNLFPCACQICIMECLLNLAYRFARKKNKSYPQMWNMHEQADEEWLIDFEMTHGMEFSLIFQHSNICHM